MWQVHIGSVRWEKGKVWLRDFSFGDGISIGVWFCLCQTLKEEIPTLTLYTVKRKSSQFITKKQGQRKNSTGSKVISRQVREWGFWNQKGRDFLSNSSIPKILKITANILLLVVLILTMSIFNSFPFHFVWSFLFPFFVFSGQLLWFSVFMAVSVTHSYKPLNFIFSTTYYY